MIMRRSASAARAACALLLIPSTLFSACHAGTSESIGTQTSATNSPASAEGAPLPADATVEMPGEVPAADPSVGNVVGSLRPTGATPEQDAAEIVARGRLIVGVDQSLNLVSYRDPRSGELRGFEIDLAREIARDLLGDPDAAEFRFLESAERLKAVSEGTVDLVIRTMTVTEERQQEAEFSTPYLTAATRLLVSTSSGISSTEDLSGHTVCVADGSTTLVQARLSAPNSPILKTRNWSDCLVAIQQGQADAILGDDVILAGIMAQDDYTEIVGSVINRQQYAVAASKDAPGLVRQVNSTIERIRSDGTWRRMHERWFSPYGISDTPPALNYRSETTEENGARDATE